MAALNDHVLKLLKISQLDSVLSIVPTKEEAVDTVFLNQIEQDLGDEPAENGSSSG